jgi:hypothetical protein
MIRTALGILAASATIAACSSNSTKTATPASSSAVASAPAKVATPAVTACPTPAPGPPTTVQYTAPATSQTQAVLNSVQVAAGTCTDIATFTFAGPDVPGYQVKYEPAALACGSGNPVTTAGPAQLTLRFEPAVAHDSNGNLTVSPLSFAPNLATIKELKSTCDFEGVVAWVIGTESRYYTVTTAQSPPRIIVEVYQ